MEKFLKKSSWTDVIISLLFIIFGIMLIARPDTIMSVVSILLGIISIIISIKTQSESNKINQDTEKKLIEIKNLSDNINKTSDRIESNIKTQIDRIINSSAPTQDEKLQQQLLTTILPTLIENPDTLSKLVEMGNNKK